MLKAELIDKTGTVVAVVRQTENYEHSFSGIISIPVSWNLYDDSYREDFLQSLVLNGMDVVIFGIMVKTIHMIKNYTHTIMNVV